MLKLKAKASKKASKSWTCWTWQKVHKTMRWMKWQKWQKWQKWKVRAPTGLPSHFAKPRRLKPSHRMTSVSCHLWELGFSPDTKSTLLQRCERDLNLNLKRAG